MLMGRIFDQECLKHIIRKIMNKSIIRNYEDECDKEAKNGTNIDAKTHQTPMQYLVSKKMRNSLEII